MSRHDDKPSLDQVLGSIREDDPTPREIDAAADRVRTALGFDAPAASASPIHIESCADFQALMPQHVAGSLPRATSLLIDDHSRECLPCRRALLATRKPAAAGAAAIGSVRINRTPWLVAASLAAVTVLAGYTAWRALPGLVANPELKVARVDGELFRVSGNQLVPLTAGMIVPAGQTVRTAKESGAMLEMPDGSRIEMRDRTELGVKARRGGSTVQLAGGSIIIEAAPQGRNRLQVATDDCTATVKGTIFSVNNGTKGSRVSVVEGSVEMNSGGSDRLLRSGEQGTTSAAVDSVSVADEVAWSQDAKRYGLLLEELASLRKDLDARVPNPKLRYGSRLLDQMPQETVLYVAIPNLTDAILEARNVFMEHVAESEVLQAWWNEHMSAPEHQAEMDKAFDHIKEVGSLLGDEVVIALAMDNDGKVRGPMVSAEVSDLWALRRAFKNQDPDFDADVTVKGKTVIIEPKRKGQEVAKLSGFDFKGNPFRNRLAASYAGGVSWLFGANLDVMMKGAVKDAVAHGRDATRINTTWENMGLLDARYLIAERDESATSATMRAELTFDGPRHGVAGWLSDPAPMGALEFVSPEASFAAAGVIKRPEFMITEAISWISADGSDPLKNLAEFKTSTGVDPIHDIAGALGGDVALAVDGPFLPFPSWKLAIEVYDAPRLQNALERLTTWVNGRLEAEGRPERMTFGSEDAGNRTDWVLRFTGTSELGVNNVIRYTIVDGYLVAAPSSVLLDRAIEQRGNGYTLTRSKGFMDLLPRDGNVNVSALMYQNVGPTLGPVLNKIAGIVDDEAVRTWRAYMTDAKPSLITLSAENDRIVFGSQGDPGFGSMLGSVVSMNQLSFLPRMIHDAEMQHQRETKQ
ncbi:MAG TPA: FecR family protein [Candidatus Polarisedimenticolaceae bacterium]|nr:FecR family protein [Candidatus Polarisedimenticolaceae bacterium]